MDDVTKWRPERMAWNFCPICGKALEVRDDGQSDRPCCTVCRKFYYMNPVPAACCFLTRGEELLFVQRSVEPRRGFWTLPGGFVELGESTDEAALRELREETSIVGKKALLFGASTKTSKHAGGVVVMGYWVPEWEGEPVPDTDAMAAAFFGPEERPPIAFEAHEELLEAFDTFMAGRE